MAHAVWTSLAEAELEDIIYHIAVEHGQPLTADRIAREIRQRANWFADHAEVGHRHVDFPRGWLYFLHKRWLVLNQPHEEGIEVLRIIDASREFTRLLPP